MIEDAFLINTFLGDSDKRFNCKPYVIWMNSQISINSVKFRKNFRFETPGTFSIYYTRSADKRVINILEKLAPLKQKSIEFSMGWKYVKDISFYSRAIRR